jgi:hypothetical protein
MRSMIGLPAYATLILAALGFSTIRPAVAAYIGSAPLLVQSGGTGATTLTTHGLIVGEGASALTALSPAADSIPLWQSATADPTVTAINNCSAAGNALTYSTTTHAFGCNTISGSSGFTETTYTGTSPYTPPTTNNLVSVISMASPAPLTINLPAAQAAGFQECVKSGSTNAATFNFTVKVSSGNIDGTTGTTGIVMNQNGESLCFLSDGTSYWVM